MKSLKYLTFLEMKQLIIVGRFLYGIGIAAIGLHQLILTDFRPEIFPAQPRWPHQSAVFPIVIGLALIFAGIVISGLIKIKPAFKEDIALYLGFCFLVLLTACHLPYILIYSADKATRLDVWFGAGEALCYAGGAFVMAGSFSVDSKKEERKNAFVLWLEKFIPLGRVFFAILIILFGFSHFVFADFVSTMVPKWIGMPLFWTYFVGVALIGSGIAIIFKIWIRPIAFLLAM